VLTDRSAACDYTEDQNRTEQQTTTATTEATLQISSL
jgi:hypothetical protein